jgi:hypothetical protein
MRRHAEAKRQAGFGQFMELPACVYAYGTLLGVLDYYQDVIYYVLPKDASDLGCNYVRCKRWRPSEGIYIPGPLQPWNDGERTGTFIPTDQVARVTHFSRGMLNQARYAALSSGQECSIREQLRVKLFGGYIGRLERLISKYRYWNIDLDRYLRLIPDAEQETTLRKLLADGDFDLLVGELERIKTTDSEPFELSQGEEIGTT